MKKFINRLMLISMAVFCYGLLHASAVEWLITPGVDIRTFFPMLFLGALYIAIQTDAFYRLIKNVTPRRALAMSIVTNICSNFILFILLFPLPLMGMLLNNMGIWLTPVIFYFATVFITISLLTSSSRYTSQQLVRPLLVGQLIPHILLYLVVIKYLEHINRLMLINGL